MMVDFLICPVCGQPLVREEKSLFCTGEKRHCYDIASAGYVNLLPPGKGGNAKSGDDSVMISARAKFLAGGYYDCFSDSAAEAVLPYVSDRPEIRFCDAGCGEGYHTVRIAENLAKSTGKSVFSLGVDASKKGVALGAKRVRTRENCSFVAGNIFSLPVADGSLDILYSIFAPISEAEARRVLRPDGLLVVISSAPRHLWELRCLLYDEPRESTPPKPPENCQCVRTLAVREKAEIPTAEEVQALFAMTPFAWRTPQAGKDRLMKTEKLTVSVEADISVYKMGE